MKTLSRREKRKCPLQDASSVLHPGRQVADKGNRETGLSAGKRLPLPADLAEGSVSDGSADTDTRLVRAPRKGEKSKKVFVLDKKKRPLMPCSPKRARKLLEKGRAVVHRLHPFTIRLKDRLLEDSVVQPVRLKIDPGSKVTGFALVREDDRRGVVLHLSELHHKQDIKHKMERRRGFRRQRRGKLWYRKERFLNRKRADGWLPPSLRARVENILSWVERYRRLCPITAISVELAKFDIQKLVNPEISGVEYQRGELFGYEVKEYLLEKWGRKCAYCGVEGVPLQIEHIVPKSRGGTNRVSNLTLSCHPCNERKGLQTAEEFGYPEVQKKAKQPLKDAAAVNATRWALWRELAKLGLPLEVGTGGRTKHNREVRGMPKRHCLDALCVGATTPEVVVGWKQEVLKIVCIGRGKYQRAKVNGSGAVVSFCMEKKVVHGIKSGDYVKAKVTKGKYEGEWVGYVTVRRTGYFDLCGGNGQKRAQGINWRYVQVKQRGDGYRYAS